MNEKRKKMMKIIIGLVALAMIISTFAGVFVSRGSNKGEENNVTKENINKQDKKEITENISKVIPEKAKKDMQNAKVQVKGNAVDGTIVLNEELNQIQLDNLASEYGKTLSQKYKGKDIKVKVIYKNEVASEFNLSGISIKGMPKAEVQIEKGLVMSNRYVRVTLDTPNPEKYSVQVLGKKLEYKSQKKYFHNVIDSYDENAIKKSIKITINK